MLRGEGFPMQVGSARRGPALSVGSSNLRPTAGRWGQAVIGGLGAQTLATLPATQVMRCRRFAGSAQPPPRCARRLDRGDRMDRDPRGGQARPGDDFVAVAAGGRLDRRADLGKADGARVIGIAGRPVKTAHLVDNLGFDAAIDYKHEDVNARLSELCPDGVNVFFDNVGGPILDAVLDNIAMRARVIICGAVSQYDDMDDITGPSMYLRLAERQSRMEGFAYFHFPDRHPSGHRRTRRMGRRGIDRAARDRARGHRPLPRGPAVHVRRRQHRQAAGRRIGAVKLPPYIVRRVLIAPLVVVSVVFAAGALPIAL